MNWLKREMDGMCFSEDGGAKSIVEGKVRWTKTLFEQAGVFE